MKHIIIYLAIALVMFGLLGWYFAQQEDLQPKALQAELSVSNVAKLPQQKVEMLFSDMSNEEKNSFRIAIKTSWAPRWMWQPTTVWAVRRCR